MNTRHPQVVVIGASTGGVSALLEIAAGLPRAFAAPVIIVQHVGTQPSILPQLLQRRGSNPALHAEDGQPLTAGTLHIAPPDRHLLLEGDTLRLTRGPKENHARPAIDPLFFSAALSCGAGAIGVILTGQMDDGAAGLRAVKDCGGLAIVQDPATAVEPEMPRSALYSVDADYCVPLQEIAPLLVRLVREGGGPQLPPPERIAREAAIQRGDLSMENLSAIGDLSPLTCPDCHGSLWELRQDRPLRYRCHLGHAYTARSLMQVQEEAAEEALWNGIRSLRERQFLLRRFAALAESAGDAAQASVGRAAANRLQEQIDDILRIAQVSEDDTSAEEDPQAG